VGAVAATAGELAKPGGSLSPRSLKLLLGAQLAAVCLLALALLLVQWQLSALRAATVPPVGEVRSPVHPGLPPPGHVCLFLGNAHTEGQGKARKCPLKETVHAVSYSGKHIVVHSLEG